jgi:5-formyltetrahydrofolate cyclo-ligase
MAESPEKSPKKVLRDAARHARSTLTHGQMQEKSAAISLHLMEILEGIDPVMVYVSKPLEVCTHRILEDLLCQKKRVVVPIIQQDTRTLRLSCLLDPSCLVESTFRVMEPIRNEIPVNAAEVRAVIVPMLAFDRKGNRLGYGAGYYDRFLEENPHLLKIGLAFSCQEITALPADTHDVRMDLILTENGVIDCRLH